MHLHLQQFSVDGKNPLWSKEEKRNDKEWQAAGLRRGPRSSCGGCPDGGALGMGVGSTAPSCFVPVYASPLSLPRSSRSCQDPSFGSLIISASLPHCMCNDLFTSLCRLPLPDWALPKDRAVSCSRLPLFLLPHTAWHREGPANCIGTLIYFTKVSRSTNWSPSFLRRGLMASCASPLSRGMTAHTQMLNSIKPWVRGGLDIWAPTLLGNCLSSTLKGYSGGGPNPSLHTRTGAWPRPGHSNPQWLVQERHLPPTRPSGFRLGTWVTERSQACSGRAGTRGASDADPEERPRDAEKLSPGDIIGTSGSSHAWSPLLCSMRWWMFLSRSI